MTKDLPYKFCIALLFALSAFLAGLTLVGCSTSREMDPAGVYGGDKILFDADTFAANVFDSMDDFVDFAERNPTVVAENPSFASAVEDVKANRLKWKADYFAVRDAYELARTVANRQSLDASLALLRAIMIEIQTRSN